MQMQDIGDVCSAAAKYLAAEDVENPFFAAFDAAADLSQLITYLSSCEIVRLSDFCNTPQALPDEDLVVASLTRSSPGRIMLLGLGEYAALIDQYDFVQRMFGLSLGKARVVVPLWNGYDFLEKYMTEDPRIFGRRAVAVEKTGRHWMVKKYRKGINLHPDADGFKALLSVLERGRNDTVSAVTSMRLNGKWCREIDSAYALYLERHPGCAIPQGLFSEDIWKRFLDDYRERDVGLFSPDGLRSVYEESGNCDAYTRLALGRTNSYSEWRWNLVNSILSVKPDQEGFIELYNQRKAILMKNLDGDADDYVENTRRFSEPSLQLEYLTDSTIMERAEILRAVTRGKCVPDVVRRVYPLLFDYTRDFQFSGSEFAAVLTGYFRDYKRQKLYNCIEPKFLSEVREISERRPQFVLPTRESVLEKLAGAKVRLCWLDALGCEFLGLIQSVAERLGLKVKVTPTRSRLPSITSENRGFFDSWPGLKFDKRDDLDDIKHGDFDCPIGDRRDYPAQLQFELIAVEDIVVTIAKWLKGHSTSKVVLTSDHGATRLAVVADSETTWEMPENGVHGGRCCKVSEFDGELPSCVTNSDDDKWHVLAGYDRFKGGRAGSVEVHGGATLEEMVVPVIEFELLDHEIHVELIENKFRVTYKDTEIRLTIFSTSKLSSPAIDIGGVRYIASCKDGSGRYEVCIPKPSAGDYAADVFDGDTKVGSVKFNVVSGGATVNSMNDFFGG